MTTEDRSIIEAIETLLLQVKQQACAISSYVYMFHEIHETTPLQIFARREETVRLKT